MKHSPRFVAVSEAAKANIQEINSDALKQKLDALTSGNNADFLLIDVREQSEWDSGHLPEAIFLSKGVIERDIEKTEQNPDREIILYCGGGYRSAIAAESLQRMGYTNVYSLAGGFREWCEKSFPLSA